MAERERTYVSLQDICTWLEETGVIPPHQPIRGLTLTAALEEATILTLDLVASRDKCDG
jgi:hypothetical protein